jgi:Helix-turn-helix of DDE superfamily endonuclease
MNYEATKKLTEKQFRRLTGIERNMFSRMIQILEEEQLKKIKDDFKDKLRLEDQLLMALEYTTEHRTYFHIGESYGVTERSAYKIIRWIDSVLIKTKDFALPRKRLLKSDIEFQVILLD